MYIFQLRRQASKLVLDNKREVLKAMGIIVGIFIAQFIVDVLLTWNESAMNSFLSMVVSFVFIPFGIGVSFLFLRFFRTNHIVIDEMFCLYKNIKSFFRYIALSILIAIYVFLWSLLLFIPGIIKGIAYSQAIFILKDNPELTLNGAITKSRHMMKGHKREYFLLHLSFIGWFLLIIFTFGIASLYVFPYYYTTLAAFYEYVKGNKEEKKAVF